MMPVPPIVPHIGATLTASAWPEYGMVPASADPFGMVMTEWELDAEDLLRLWRGGRVRIWVQTEGQPLPSIQIETVDPDCGYEGTV